MEASLQSQVYVFAVTLLGGMLIGLSYDFYRLFRYYFKPKKIKTYIEDLIFWLLLSLGITLLVNKINEGEFRGFIFIGFTIGILLYSRLLSKRIIKSISYVVNFITDKIIKLIEIITNPFKSIVSKIKKTISKMKRYLSIPKLFYYNMRKNIKTVLKKS